MFGFKLVREKKAKTNRKRKRHFADFIVYISIIMIVSYTVAAIVLQYLGMMEISATLTTCWYGFWTAEIITLATIKNAKTKNSKQQNNDNFVPPTHSEANSKSQEE